MTARTPAQAIETLELFDRLARLPRTGWLLHGVTQVESIAEHSFGVCVVAMLLVDDLRAQGVAVNGERVFRMAIVHDAAEAFTGDIPMPAKSPTLDAALEAAEGELLRPVLTEPELELWREGEAGATLEARVVKAADKLQLLFKALTYERQRRGRLDDFWKKRSIPDLDFARGLLAELERLVEIERSAKGA